MTITKRTTTQQNKRVYNKTNYTTHNLTMYKKIKRVYTTLKAVLGNRYIDIAKTNDINKNGVMCFY